MESKKVWYAVMMDNEDTDHGCGFWDIDSAIDKVRSLRDNGYTCAYIAVIDPDDDFCIDDIRDL